MNAKQVRKLLEADAQQFLPETLVMIDLEMTGVVPERDDIIQIAMLKLKLDGEQYVAEGEPLELYPHSDKTPSNGFHNKYLTHIFKKSNESSLTIEEAKKQIEDWLGDLKGTAIPCGEAIQVDMAFLHAKGLVDRSDFEGDKAKPGTFHYENFDLNAPKTIARQKIGFKADKELPFEEGIHDAMVDCRNQLLELNWALKTLLS